MKKTIQIAAAGVAGALALTGCTSAASSTDDESSLSLVAFSVMEQPNDTVLQKDFLGSDAAGDVEKIAGSYGASGDQSRAVVDNLPADVVHFSLETDVTRLVDAGKVAEDWKTSSPTGGIATSSVVVFVVRPGNPDKIEGWDDLVDPDVDIITPNPGSSGSARWNILAAWAHVIGDGGTEAEATDFVTKIVDNAVSLPSSGRDATSAFTEGSGDVLLSYENEAILAKQGGADIDYVVPDDTLLIQNPAAVTTDAKDGAQALLDYMTSPEGQSEYAAFGFRPVVDGVDVPEVKGANDPADPFPTPSTLYTIDDDFGGWAEAAPKFFNDGTNGDPLGIINQIIEDSGKGA